MIFRFWQASFPELGLGPRQTIPSRETAGIPFYSYEVQNSLLAEILPGPVLLQSHHLRGPLPCFISWAMFIKVPLRGVDLIFALTAGFRCQTRLREVFLGAERARRLVRCINYPPLPTFFCPGQTNHQVASFGTSKRSFFLTTLPLYYAVFFAAGWRSEVRHLCPTNKLNLLPSEYNYDGSHCRDNDPIIDNLL
jgi:hypothetical protein